MGAKRRRERERGDNDNFRQRDPLLRRSTAPVSVLPPSTKEEEAGLPHLQKFRSMHISFYAFAP